MKEDRWEFWINIMGLAREYISLDKSSAEAKEHIEHAEKLFREEYVLPQTEMVLERFSELEDLNKVEITVSMMDDIKECIYSYVSNRYTSAIVLSGLITERITKDLLSSRLNLSSKTIDNLNQSSKTDLLKEQRIITQEIAEKLHQIRKIRNKYIHIKEQNPNKEKHALLVLTKLIDLVYRLYEKKEEVKIIEGNAK